VISTELKKSREPTAKRPVAGAAASTQLDVGCKINDAQGSLDENATWGAESVVSRTPDTRGRNQDRLGLSLAELVGTDD